MMKKERINILRKVALLVVAMIIGAASAMAQKDRMITGIVVDENGDPIPAASVKQIPVKKGELVSGILTDAQGHFRLVLANSTKTIEVSSIGFQTKVISIDKKGTYKITLLPSEEMLNEVVVTGYQTISRERATGSFSKVDTKQLETQRINSLSDMMEGRVAGLSDGKLRGVTSMNGLTTPLYVIDGLPVENTTTTGYGWTENVPDINTEDIEDITILKDAAATSIYGARAANGVIVITTKKAKKNTLDVSFSATMTVQPYRYYTGMTADAATMIGLEKEWASQNPDLQGDGAAAYAQNLLSNASYTSDGIKSILNYYAGNTSQSDMNSTLSALAAKGYQYYKDVEKYAKRNPFYQQYNVSIGRGTEKNSFNASITYSHDQNEDKYDSDERIGLHLKNSTEITKWLTLDLGTYLSYANGTDQSFSVLSPGYTVMPYNSLKNADGSNYVNRQEDRYADYNLSTLETYGLYNLDIDPLDELGMGLTKTKDFSNRTYAKLNLTFTPWLKYSAMFQYEVGEKKSEQTREKESYYTRNQVNTFSTLADDGSTTFVMPYGDIYSKATISSRNYTFRQQLDFDRTFAEKHDVTALVGMEIRENKLNYNKNTLYNYDSSTLTYSMVDQNTLANMSGLWGWGYFTKSDVAVIQELTNRYVSFYANGAYTYDGKYMVNGSIRWDRTNLFATSSKYQNKPIWSVGAAWNISKEAFFDVPFVNLLKLRASYGIGGNIAKDSAPYMTAYYSTNTHVGGQNGWVSTRPNPDLRWEKTTTFNIGVDFALLDNRITGSIEYYNKNGEDLLANTNGVPTEGWGYSTYTINNGKMRNRGFEISLSADAIRNKDWRWNIGGVFGYNKNKVTYVNVECPVLYLLWDYPTAYPQIGNAYNAIYAFEWAGLSEEGLPQVYDKDGNIYSTSEPEQIADAKYQGTTVPVWNGAINTSLSYKDWELAAQFTFEGGHKMRDTYLPYLSSFGSVCKDIENRWQKAGDEKTTNVPRYVSSESPLYNYYSYEIYAYSSINVIDADNWALKRLSLTYRVPTDFCHKFFVKSARVMIGMENVFFGAKSDKAKYLLGGYTRPNYLCSVNVNF